MNEHFYETGSTQPPKSRVFMVCLLVLLIFSGGIFTALGFCDISLRDRLKKEEAVSVRFTREEPSTASTSPTGKDGTGVAGLGIRAETVSPFARAYYRLPRGVYLPHVPRGSSAAAAGVLPGDILLEIDRQRITNTEELSALLRRYRAGDPVTLTLYRRGETLPVAFTLMEE